MPIKLRCYCGYVLTLRSSLAGKKIRCTECDEVLTVPVPERVKASRKTAVPKKRRPPQRDPWDVDDFGSQPGYEQPQYFLPGPAAHTQAPKRLKKKSSQTEQQVTKYVGIALVVVFFGCAVLLGMFAMKNRVRFESPEKERARVLREVGQGKLVGRTYTNEYFKLKLTIPESYHILDRQENKNVVKSLHKNSDKMLTSREKSIAAREILLLWAVKAPQGASDIPEGSLLVIANRIGNVPGIETPKKYLESKYRSQFSSQQGNDQVESVREGYHLGSLQAVSMYAKFDDHGTVIPIRIYAARVRDYHLLVIHFCTSESTHRELERLVRSIQASE